MGFFLAMFLCNLLMPLIVEAVQLAILLGSIVPVEKALKRTFDENDVRR